jgi:hypothetical protein
MKLLTVTLTVFLLAGSAAAQRHKLDSINAETPEGKLLAQIGNESDLAKKATLMEEFGKSFGQHKGAGWVLSQLQDVYAKNNQPDKAIDAGERLLAMDATDLDAAWGNLKAAEAKKDVDGVLKWSAKTTEIAPKVPADEADHAKDVLKYTEYALFSVAVQESDPAKSMKLVEAIPAKSDYMAQALPKYAAAARQANAIPQAVAFGEKLYGAGVANEDLLLLMADASMRAQKNDKTAEYGVKAAQLAGSRPKPEGVSDADWEKRKNALVGMGNWMAGMGYAAQNKFSDADKVLRTALPLVKDQQQVYNMALFNLGLANYQLARASKNKAQITDALKFTEQAAATPGPFQAQAQKNVPVIKKEFALK